jgi:internalin A
MFIKRDNRPIYEILADESKPLERLRLVKRPQEFKGNVRVLVMQPKVANLRNLQNLNLYDNMLEDLTGLGDALKGFPLVDINLGRNEIKSIPIDFGSLKSLISVALDDNQLEEFPLTLFQLENLETLRLSGNRLEIIPDSISRLTKLTNLAVDNNEIEEFPNGVLSLPCLKYLWLRQNNLTELPDGLSQMTTLETLSISSNKKLDTLPESICDMPSLTQLYINSCNFEVVPTGLLRLQKIQELNLSCNYLKEVPDGWEEKWGKVDHKTGILGGPDASPSVKFFHNPFIVEEVLEGGEERAQRAYNTKE